MLKHELENIQLEIRKEARKSVHHFDLEKVQELLEEYEITAETKKAKIIEILDLRPENEEEWLVVMDDGNQDFYELEDVKKYLRSLSVQEFMKCELILRDFEQIIDVVQW